MRRRSVVAPLIVTAVVLVACTMFISVKNACSEGPGNVRNTKHNFSSTGAGYPVQPGAHAQTVDEVCVFCHTPHRALSTGPLWNHNMSAIASYSLFTSPTLLSPPPSGNKPDGDSLLCLSCHDGDQPVGAVQNYGGEASTIVMTGTSMTGGRISVGLGTNFGSDLTGHHPVSIEINDCLVNDKLNDAIKGCPSPDVSWYLKVPTTEFMKPTNNRYGTPCSSGSGNTNKGVQCSSCHDVHSENWMFLRAGNSPPNPWGGRDYSDNLCISCHVACP